jgi:hypothetical protein
MTTTSTASRRTNVKTYVRLRPADDDDEMLIQPLDNGTTCRVHNNWSDSVVETDGVRTNKKSCDAIVVVTKT